MPSSGMLSPSCTHTDGEKVQQERGYKRMSLVVCRLLSVAALVVCRACFYWTYPYGPLPLVVRHPVLEDLEGHALLDRQGEGRVEAGHVRPVDQGQGLRQGRLWPRRRVRIA